MHICILVTGEPPEPLKGQFGDYPSMFERLISPHAPQFSFSTANALTNEGLPPVSSFDGLLITGSPAGVYEEHKWIAPCEVLIKETATAGKPQVGICFGHQLMAQAFGGKAIKSERGWGVGVHRYNISNKASWMVPAANQIACAVSHQDQVIEAPSGARTLGGSEFCPAGILEYAQGPAISFQQHPEFGHDYGLSLLKLREDRIPPDRFGVGVDSYQNRTDRDLMGQWIANFFTQNAS
ncbi:glutamine amidotransferase-related protein [Hyphococcus lacteus]|uniref:Glutamine amidotransferase n=1 Tax=Hyphococcus lacteus TaxID=3143536 RepID=A0ABV3Z363_9PROT